MASGKNLRPFFVDGSQFFRDHFSKSKAARRSPNKSPRLRKSDKRPGHHHQADMLVKPPHRSKSLWLIACSTVMLALMLLARFQLQQVAAGHLFLFSMPWDAPPSAIELIDAKLSVAEVQTAAVVVVAVIALVLMITGSVASKRLQQQKLLSRSLLVIFAVAVCADMFSTVWFFHVQGIDFEFHPAIRLFGYAYGRTTGPIAGKLIQAAGVLYVAILLKGRGRFLIYVVTAVYLFASIYNVSQTLAALKT